MFRRSFRSVAATQQVPCEQGHFTLAGQGIGRLSPLSPRERGFLRPASEAQRHSQHQLVAGLAGVACPPRAFEPEHRVRTVAGDCAVAGARPSTSCRSIRIDIRPFGVSEETIFDLHDYMINRNIQNPLRPRRTGNRPGPESERTPDELLRQATSGEGRKPCKRTDMTETRHRPRPGSPPILQAHFRMGLDFAWLDTITHDPALNQRDIRFVSGGRCRVVREASAGLRHSLTSDVSTSFARLCVICRTPVVSPRPAAVRCPVIARPIRCQTLPITTSIRTCSR